ncbi:MAG TPA: glycosyl hydrolase [Candidatus Sulfotelmatobacter sp.]|nr:glycosyl hydrolase [Candidatus Sulfotelmatobacter sp.]
MSKAAIACSLAVLFVAMMLFAPHLCAQGAKFDSDTISGLGARNIGSATMSGRVAALTAVKEDGRLTVYIGAASGGVWKSVNDGTTFKPVFDKQPVQSIGAIAVDPQAPKTIWVGTGEAWTRNSVSLGDGIYRSTDGGENWTNLGLKDSERISKILIDPKDSNVVYVCVPGKLWSDSEERGVYKTTDGGKTWNKILKGANLSTGCSMMSMDAHNSKVLYAGLWDFRRKGWTFRSGGDGPTATSGSAFYKSTDGGATWNELDDKTAPGLPPKPWGRIAVTVAPSNSNVVYALIESTRSALFYSNDAGKTWQERDRSNWMVWRPFYFANLIVDPKNENKVYKPDLTLIMSEDGGKSFSSIGNGAHGDFHDVWVDPDNTDHLIAGDDGGVWYSYDAANNWWKANNLPISQFYHVSSDMADPYQVYGGLQDNSTFVGDSQYPGGITNSRWENLFNGDGFWAFSDTGDANYAYAEFQGGEIGRINRRTLEKRFIKPQPNYGETKLRFNWNTPIHMSPNEKGTIYIGAQYLFRSRDHGQTWDRISPDLTTNDPEKQKQEESGGVTVDNSSAEMHTTIYSISESPRDGNVIWVGTDDGNLQLTRDGGKNWTNLVANVPNLPKFSWVSWVEASVYDPATAYATFDRHTFGDMEPHVFKTTDYGKTWTPIVASDSGVRGYAYVIKEDTVSRNLLFLGTEFGLWISPNGGKHWAQYKGRNFPCVSVRDLVVQNRDSDLVVATHGRGIWIIDDITPLRHLTPEVLAEEAGFLPGRPEQQRINTLGGGWAEGNAAFSGSNPPDGVSITYYQQKRHIFGRMKLEVFDSEGKLVDTLPSNNRRGISRVVWNMRLKPPRVPPAAAAAFEAAEGPRVVPGTYTVKLTRGQDTYTEKIVASPDARAKYSVEDRKADFDAIMRVYNLLGDMSYDVDRINGVRTGLLERASRLPKDPALAKQLQELSAKVDDLRKKIVATKEGGAITGEERIREKTTQLYGALDSYEGRPADYQVARIDSLKKELGDVEAEFDALLAKELPAVNKSLTKQKLPPIQPITRKDWDAANSSEAAGAKPGTAPFFERD